MLKKRVATLLSTFVAARNEPNVHLAEELPNQARCTECSAPCAAALWSACMGGLDTLSVECMHGEVMAPSLCT